MSTDFWMCSTANIIWDEFYSYLNASMERLKLVETDANPDNKAVWLLQPDLKIKFNLGLIHKIDDTGFLIQQSIDELHFPFETGLSGSVYYQDDFGKADRLTLELLCCLAEKWPVVVENSSVIYYNNAELFQLLKNGERFFPIIS